MARSGFHSVTVTNNVHSQLVELAALVTEQDKRKVGVSGVIARLIRLYGQEFKAELEREREPWSFLNKPSNPVTNEVRHLRKDS